MKRIFITFLVLFMSFIMSQIGFCGVVGESTAADDANLLSFTSRAQKDMVFQISTYDAFQKGYYNSGENRVTAGKKYGRFGFGVIKDKTGALVFDGEKIWRIRDFKLSSTKDEEYIPISYGMFKKFKTDDRAAIKDVASMAEFVQKIDAKLETLNYFVAVKANGAFNSIILQNEGGERKVVQNVRGALIGFRTPEFYSPLAQKGYTLYFISDDKLLGGKVYELNASLISFYLDYSNRCELILPKDKSFKIKDFSQYAPIVDKKKQAEKKVEKKDLQKMMNQGSSEPTPDEMMQMFAPKMSF